MSRPLGIRPARRDADVLRRRPPAYEPQPQVLIVCEGNKTEPLYFNALRRYRRLSATRIDIVPGGISGSDPRSIVRYARKRKKWMKRRGRKFEHVWCVFDRDEHPRIEEAFLWAEQSHFDLAFSNPCFELWFLLHFEEVCEPLDRFEAFRLVRRRMPQYRKTASVYHLLLDRQKQAIERAEALRAHQSRRGGRADGNPSTTVDLLVNFLNSLDGRSRAAQHRKLREEAMDSAETPVMPASSPAEPSPVRTKG